MMAPSWPGPFWWASWQRSISSRAGFALLADEPSFVPEGAAEPCHIRCAGPSAMRNTDSSKSGFKPPFRTVALTHSSPFGIAGLRRATMWSRVVWVLRRGFEFG